MLAGRALNYAMFPFTHVELGDSFNLTDAMSWGGLPEAIFATNLAERKAYLDSYCETYLKEEVFAEQLARQLEPFRNFVECASQDNGHILNFDKIGRQIGVSGKTVANYYSILVETYLGILLYPVHESTRKKIVQKPKFYFFDTGIQRALAGTLDIRLESSTNLFGDTFEHLVILEAWRLNRLYDCGWNLGFLDVHGGVSTDLVLQKSRRPKIYIEIKSADQIRDDHLKHLKILKAEEKNARFLCLSRDGIERVEDGIEILPWDAGLRKIFTSSKEP